MKWKEWWEIEMKWREWWEIEMKWKEWWEIEMKWKEWWEKGEVKKWWTEGEGREATNKIFCYCMKHLIKEKKWRKLSHSTYIINRRNKSKI